MPLTTGHQAGLSREDHIGGNKMTPVIAVKPVRIIWTGFLVIFIDKNPKFADPKH